MLNPPQTYEVFPQVKGLLETAGVVTAMGGYGVVVIAEGDVIDVGWPDPAENGFRWRIVLMAKINGLKAPEEHLDKVRGFSFRTRIDVQPPSDDSFNTKHFLEGAHLKTYQALHMQKVTLTKAEQLYSIIRREHPTPMFRDAEQGFRFMSAEYLTILGPTQ